MAFDKVVDSTKLFAGMTATANAIREKTGSTDPIKWEPDTGFKTAVEGIEAGGGGNGEFSYICDSYEIHTKIVTVGENTVTNTQGAYDYFQGLMPGKLIGAFLLSPYGNLNNQFILCEGGGLGSPNVVRFRNGALGKATIAASYDGFLEVGSQYFIYSDVLPAV